MRRLSNGHTVNGSELRKQKQYKIKSINPKTKTSKKHIFVMGMD